MTGVMDGFASGANSGGLPVDKATAEFQQWLAGYS
jgi:hypothetical protein